MTDTAPIISQYRRTGIPDGTVEHFRSRHFMPTMSQIAQLSQGIHTDTVLPLGATLTLPLASCIRCRAPEYLREPIIGRLLQVKARNHRGNLRRTNAVAGAMHSHRPIHHLARRVLVPSAVLL